MKSSKNFKKPKISYICDKTLPLSSICNKCGSEDGKTFKEEESTEILKLFGLTDICKMPNERRKHKSRV